ncbi:hypothetical protein [uncultured Chryseobacterium sp.]|uniref:hypothetical protein n=1 Tax=uncultured Chryseobacterium sp. TaxID=259322 RepID=UPI002586809A|nr:hypothetical protein [uncultured Chryseobacterium sp.]
MIKDLQPNLRELLSDLPNGETLFKIYSSILEFTIINRWEGACHESCGALHILLSENDIQNEWFIGEVKNKNVYFDHSWIEINNEIFDIAILFPLVPECSNAPIIRSKNLNDFNLTTIEYGVYSGEPLSEQTKIVKELSLSDYLFHSPINKVKGTFALIEMISETKLNKRIDLDAIRKKYNKICYKEK